MRDGLLIWLILFKKLYFEIFDCLIYEAALLSVNDYFLGLLLVFDVALLIDFKRLLLYELLIFSEINKSFNSLFSFLIAINSCRIKFVRCDDLSDCNNSEV